MTARDDYRSTLHAQGWRRTAEGKLTHPHLIALWRKLKPILQRHDPASFK